MRCSRQANFTQPWSRVCAYQGFETRDTKEYLENIVKRNTIREAILKAMADNRVDALAYPTIRRKANLIGEVQMGTNCYLASKSACQRSLFRAVLLQMGCQWVSNCWSEPGASRS
jgi:hypothetical protein